MIDYENLSSLRKYVLTEKNKNILELEKAASEWTRVSQKNKLVYEIDWFGVPIIQTPQDMILMQELIFKIKPDVIIDVGLAHGGSLIYYSSLLELLGKGKVIGVDIDIREHNRKVIEAHPLFKRIELIEGSSISEKVIKKIEEKLPENPKIIVCLDSNHKKDHVLEELKLYQKFINKESYMVVFDTNTSDLVELGACEEEYRDNGPKEAINEFLKINKDFEIDKDYNKLFISASPNGYLKRIEDREQTRGKNEKLIPKILTIETVFGCNSHCSMCPIDLPTPRKKGIMPVEMSNYVLDELAPYNDKIDMLNFFALGEPLLDEHLFQRIEYAKKKGYKNIAISTNADLLDKEKQRKLLETGIDTVLFSLDGMKKETHENIRRGVNFERVMENCQSIIKMRDEGNYKTRFIIRFIQQESNKDEWEDYKKFWGAKLSNEKNDMITCYPMHSWGGQVSTKESILDYRDPEIEKKSCPRPNELLVVLADGSVPLCHEDFHKAIYNFGNVKDTSPLEIFNSEEFNKIRKIHADGNKNSLKLCNECTVLYSMGKKEEVKY